MSDRRQRLADARLYLVCDQDAGAYLGAVLSAGVDVIQLRMKNAPDDQITDTGCRFAQICGSHGVLFILNDRPDLAAEIGADGVHVGQDDADVAQARAQVGAERLIGLSTHSREQVRRAHGVDYIGVGPVHTTPTKPGRPAVGLDLVRYAAERATVPFFAIGGINSENIDAVRDAGAGRIAVVRAITEAESPAAAARTLRLAMEAGKDRIGAT